MMDNENVTLEDMFDELDEWSRETDALNGVPIRSTEGDVRGLKRVPVAEEWGKAKHIVSPVSDSRVQEYLQKKDDKPFALPKVAVLTFAGFFVAFGIVHSISSFIRNVQEEASKNYADVIMADEDGDSNSGKSDGSGRGGDSVPGKNVQRTELKTGEIYRTTDGQLEFTYNDGKYAGQEGLTITGYLGNATEVTLPKDIQGYPVVGVNRSTLEGNNTVEKVVVESEISKLDFRDCAALKEVVFPVTVNEIGRDTFYNTPALEKVTVDKGCYVSDEFAYEVSPVVNYVEMSEGASDTSHIEMVDGHNYYTADGQFQFRFQEGSVQVRRYIGDSTEVTVPKEIQGYPVTNLARIFEGNNFIEKVTIEAQIESANDIFRDNEALKEVTLPASVTRIGYTCFYNTPSLQTLNVHEGCEVDSACAGYDVQPTVNYVN
mgnify:FL=1